MRKHWIFYLLGFVIFSLVFCRRLQAGQSSNLVDGQQIKLTGIVSSNPILQGNKQTFSISNFQVVTSSFPSYQYGEELIVIGKLSRQVINPYFSKFRLIYPQIQPIKSDNNKREDIRVILNRFRSQIETKFSQQLSEPEASLLSGIVLGVKSNLPDDFYQSLQKTSTLHIVVASGYNISVVSGVVLTLLAGLVRRHWAIILSTIVIFLYVLIIGADPAIVRAALMAGLALIGQLFGQEGDSWRFLISAAAVMLLINPTLFWSLSFQLSFLATLGLVLLSPRLSFLEAIKPQGLQQSLQETLAAQIMVLPILINAFGNFSWLGFLVNPLILWLVPATTALGFIQAIFSLPIFPGQVLSQLVSYFSWALLHTMVMIINFFGNLNFGQTQLEWRMSFFYIYYGIIFFWIIKTKQVGKDK